MYKAEKLVSGVAVFATTLTFFGVGLLSPVQADNAEGIAALRAGSSITVSTPVVEAQSDNKTKVTMTIDVEIPDTEDEVYDDLIINDILMDLNINYNDTELPEGAYMKLSDVEVPAAELEPLGGYVDFFASEVSSGEPRETVDVYDSKVYTLEIGMLPKAQHSLTIMLMAANQAQFDELDETGEPDQDLGLYAPITFEDVNFDTTGGNQQADLVEQEPQSVYRFYNATTGKHVIMMDYEEANNLYKNNKAWTYEGLVFMAFEYDGAECDPLPSFFDAVDLEPVYRFWNNAAQSHFYAMGAEVDQVEENPAWQKEGVVFCAAPKTLSDPALVEAHRYYRASTTSHAYTVDPVEKQSIDNNPTFVYEGVAFKVFLDGEEFEEPEVPEPTPTEGTFKENKPTEYAQYIEAYQEETIISLLITVRPGVDPQTFRDALTSEEYILPQPQVLGSNYFNGWFTLEGFENVANSEQVQEILGYPDDNIPTSGS